MYQRGTEKRLPAPHTTRAGGNDREGHPGRGGKGAAEVSGIQFFGKV